MERCRWFSDKTKIEFSFTRESGSFSLVILIGECASTRIGLSRAHEANWSIITIAFDWNFSIYQHKKPNRFRAWPIVERETSTPTIERCTNLPIQLNHSSATAQNCSEWEKVFQSGMLDAGFVYCLIGNLLRVATREAPAFVAARKRTNNETS